MPTAGWKRALRELETTLERTDVKFDVLRQIDHSIAHVGLQIDDLLYRACDLLRDTYGIKQYGIFYGIDGELLPLRQGKEWLDKNISQEMFIKVRAQTKPKVLSKKLITVPIDDHFFFVIPLVHGSVIFIAFELPIEASVRRDFCDFASNLAEQLLSLTKFVLDRRSREAQRVAYEAFFNNKLQPSACWAALLATLNLFLPDDRLAQIKPSPLRQLLTYTEGDSSLRIAAGAGTHASSYVLVDESVSGLVLKDRRKAYLLVNPRELPGLYKGYGDKGAQTELVIRLDSENAAVGIINIEHRDENAFNSLYVACMRDAAMFLSPLVAGLQARYDSFRKKEIGLLYIFTDMLSRMGDAYGHLVSQPMLSARNAIAEIRYLVESPDTSVSRQQLLVEVARLDRAISELETHSDDFTEGLPEFISYGSQPILIKLEQRLKSFRRLATAENIEVQIGERESNLCAYASSLFQEHLFNIVNNSFQQIRKRLFEDSSNSGQISIEVFRTSGVTPQDQRTGLNFIDIIISDNGGGASKADLAKIGRPGFTTKREHGSGFGVAAAKEYFESIGGDMAWRNIRGGFETTIRMQEFTPGIHSETRLIDRIRAEAMK